LLAACAPSATPSRTPTATLRLVPSRTSTATPGRPTATQAPPTPSGPTPTPLTHIVEEGETLLGIAIEYGVSLDDLITANPGISPRMLSIGQGVLIPGPEGEPVVVLAPTATPIALRFSGTVCYPSLSGGLWCLAWSRNNAGTPLEGVAAAVTLLDDQGATIEARTAYSPLNLIPEGGLILLPTYFEEAPPDFARVAVTPVSALGLADTSRYLAAQVERIETVSLSTGLAWQVNGEVRLEVEQEVEVSRGRVLVVALDADGRPVGLTTWEFGGDVAVGAPVPFEATVVSLGPVIERVEVFAEAMPTPE
jgi:LysM repeat protein